MARRLSNLDPGFDNAFRAALARQREAVHYVDDVVASVLADVRTRGDAALLDYTERFDGVRISGEQLRLSIDEIDSACSECDGASLDALNFAAHRIEDFHRRQMPETLSYTDEIGVTLGARWRPIDAVGLYVPGGSAAYPSSLLMNAIPARIAGVRRVAMTVPAPDRRIDPLVLAAAKLSGVQEIYRVGGAQAIGALAYGTETIVPVDKIVGPGNAYVVAAKRQVFGIVGIDMIAGPTEVLIVADADNDPSWIAIDLLAQAEHDVAAQSILVTDNISFADRVESAVEDHLVTLKRGDIARASWENNGLIIITENLEQAAALVDRVAPEHLELAVANPEALAADVSHAGAIFLGRHTPEAIGDYVAGPNHVLPTAGSARFSSGLSVLDFLKRTSMIRCDAESLSAVGSAAITLAEGEGLDAHARSISIRLNRP